MSLQLLMYALLHRSFFKKECLNHVTSLKKINLGELAGEGGYDCKKRERK